MNGGVVIKGMPELLQAMTEFSERRIAAATATALTRTAKDVQAAILREMPAVLDRPTPYALRSLYVRPATAERQQAEVRFKDEAAAGGGTPAAKFLLPEVQGGQRRAKRFERRLQAMKALPQGWMAVPGAGAQIDAYGNMTRAQINQILAQLAVVQAQGGGGRQALAAQRRAGGRFVVVPPGSRGAAPGVYQRELVGRQFTPVLIFVKAAQYKPRFDFFGVGQAVAAERLPEQMRRAVQEHVERLAAKSARA